MAELCNCPFHDFFFGERDEKSLNAYSMEAFIHKHHILICLYRTQAYVHYFFLSFINTFYLKSVNCKRYNIKIEIARYKSDGVKSHFKTVLLTLN